MSTPMHSMSTPVSFFWTVCCVMLLMLCGAMTRAVAWTVGVCCCFCLTGRVLMATAAAAAASACADRRVYCKFFLLMEVLGMFRGNGSLLLFAGTWSYKRILLNASFT